jgi:hypothetical protein
LTGLNQLLAQQNGVISLTQARGYLSRSAIRHRTANGTWQVAHRGVIVVHKGAMSTQQSRWVASLAAGAGTPALLGGLTALAVLGGQGLDGRPIHVLLAAHRREGDPPSGVVVHRTSRLPAEDVEPEASPPCTTAARSLVDAASWAGSDQEAVTAIALAFQQHLVTLNAVRTVLGRLPRAKRRRLTWMTSARCAVP